jgi:uncharacterized protein YbjT (DUF2867 family)
MRAQHVLVLGASGGTGRHLVLDALARGHRVRAWSADAGELAIRHARLAHFVGDARDPRRAMAAIDGVDAVISALGSTGGLAPTDLCTQATRSLVEAMQASGVRRLVAITSLGTTAKLGPVHEHLVYPRLLSGIYDDKRAQEEIVRGSGLAWVILRPGRLTDGADRRRLRAVLEGPLPGVLVSRAALARFALDQLESDAFLGLAPYVVEQSAVPWHKVLTLGADARAV